MTEDRQKLIDRFQQWFDTNPNERLIAYQCATIAEQYAKEQISKLNKHDVSNRREQLIADLHTIEAYWNVEFNNKEETADYIIMKQGN